MWASRRSNSPLLNNSSMNERRRPPRRGRGQRPHDRPAAEATGEPNPYRDEPADSSTVDGPLPDAGPSEEGSVPRVVTTAVDTARPRDVDANEAPPTPSTTTP